MDKDILGALRRKKMSIRAIASDLGCSYTTVRYWMRVHDLDTSRYDHRADKKPVCRMCGETRIENFYKDHFGACKRCFNKRRTYYIQRHRAAVNRALGGKCSVCGYARCEAALELHHTDPSKKDPGYSKLRSNKLETLLKEASKCILVCANCHRELHAVSTSLPL